MSPAKRAGLGLALTGVLSLSACGAGNVNLDPAPDAANPVCAYAMVAMPEKLVGLQQRETTAQGTTAWGEPASDVFLRRGKPRKPCDGNVDGNHVRTNARH